MIAEKYEQISLFKSSNDAFLLDTFSADNYCKDVERRNLETKYSKYLKVTDRFNRQSVSYQQSKNDGLHSWLKYKEGFSSGLVDILLDEMKAQPGDWVMDPFLGSGTTALVCQMRGINCIGLDVMPISTLAIKAKTAVLEYDVSEIEAMIDEIQKLVVPDGYTKRTPYITITRDAYPKENELFLQYIAEWRDNSSHSDNAKNLLTLCIINSLELCSYTSKVGQYLGWDCRSKKVQQANEWRRANGKKPLPLNYVRDVIRNSKTTILEELKGVLADIRRIQKSCANPAKAKIEFIPNSILYELPKMQANFLKGVITSPPYCNRYDYTRTYALELAYLGVDEQEIKKLRQSLLSCTVENHSKIQELREFYSSIGELGRFNYIYHTIQENRAFSEIMYALKKRKEHGDLNNNGVIRMVEGYFTELAFVYAELFRICKSGATVAFVNDNVRYGGEVIPVDFLSSSFAEQFGFKVKTIYTLKQQKGNSSQQMAKFGRVALRKGITVWVKE